MPLQTNWNAPMYSIQRSNVFNLQFLVLRRNKTKFNDTKYDDAVGC